MEEDLWGSISRWGSWLEARRRTGWVSSTGHEFALMLDGEAGDSGDERWGASLRWTKHF